MLVEFERARQHGFDDESSGEDDGLESREIPVARIMINPAAVTAVFASRDGNAVIVRLSGGRGFLVRGTYDEVVSKLEAGGAGSHEGGLVDSDR